MKKTTLFKSVLLLCALIAGSVNGWAQSDYSAVYTSNCTLTSVTNGSTCKVKIGTSDTEYDGIKVGTSSKGGAMKVTVPAGAKYLHVHVAAWNGVSSLSLNITPNTNISPTSIALTANTGIHDSSPFTLTGTPSSSDFYKVITFTTALAAETEFTFTTSTTKRFVIWGVNSQEEATITPATEYSTLTSAKNLDFTNVSNLKAYIATSVAGSSVNMTQVNIVPANTGLVLKATTTGSGIQVPVWYSSSDGVDDVSSNKMAGSAAATTSVAANAGYILKSGVFQPSSGGSLPAGKAYLDIAVGGAHPLEMNFEDGEVTSVKQIETISQNTGEYYNLAGQRVAQPTKGLYIVNGKKVVIK